eukprot:5733007-Amphidinium_carterae.2
MHSQPNVCAQATPLLCRFPSHVVQSEASASVGRVFLKSHVNEASVHGCVVLLWRMARSLRPLMHGLDHPHRRQSRGQSKKHTTKGRATRLQHASLTACYPDVILLMQTDFTEFAIIFCAHCSSDGSSNDANALQVVSDVKWWAESTGDAEKFVDLVTLTILKLLPEMELLVKDRPATLQRK